MSSASKLEAARSSDGADAAEELQNTKQYTPTHRRSAATTARLERVQAEGAERGDSERRSRRCRRRPSAAASLRRDLAHLRERGHRLVHVLAAALDQPVDLGGERDRLDGRVGEDDVELAIVELRVRADAVLRARELVDEATEEEEVGQRLRRPVVEGERRGQRPPRQLEDLGLDMMLPRRACAERARVGTGTAEASEPRRRPGRDSGDPRPDSQLLGDRVGVGPKAHTVLMPIFLSGCPSLSHVELLR